jgi:hypothetical protein
LVIAKATALQLIEIISDLIFMPSPSPPESVHTTEIVYTSEDEAGSPHFGPDFNPKLWTKKVWW